MADASSCRFAFVFPMMSGHINPSLPVARALVAAGHEVHYLCREQMRDAIEDTGAIFHSEIEQEVELYSGHEPDLVPYLVLKNEYDLQDKSFMEIRASLRVVALELCMPGVRRWLQHTRAQAILYDPLVNLEAAWAGTVMGIPSIGLLTFAGAGACPKTYEALMEASGCTQEDLLSIVDTYEPHLAAVERMNRTYGLGLQVRDGYEPLGYLPQLQYSTVTVVTTAEDLQDPMPQALEHRYHENDVHFEAVGPLLDVEGACRAGGFKHRQESNDVGDTSCVDADSPSTQTQIMTAVRAARAAGRPVVLISMGTMITGDSAMGWNARDASTDGSQRGLTGRELCQNAWGGAFDAFGRTEAQEGPLLLVALGPQFDALGPLEVPANCITAPSVPQVDILKAGVKLFLTHGGQNSFTEALANGTPMVVCPGFGDQIQNASKAENLGVGRQVPRPHPEAEAIVCAAAQYRADVAHALLDVYSCEPFGIAAAGCMERLQRAGGVPRVVELMLQAAAAGDCARPVAAAKAVETKIEATKKPSCGAKGGQTGAVAGA